MNKKLRFKYKIMKKIKIPIMVYIINKAQFNLLKKIKVVLFYILIFFVNLNYYKPRRYDTTDSRFCTRLLYYPD